MYPVEKTNDEYIHEESRCGYCGSYQVTFTEKEFCEHDFVWQYKCDDCKRKGLMVYYYEFAYNAYLEDGDYNGSAEG